MTPLTITLPPEVFAQVVAGEKKIISTKRNPRKDRYFAAKTPDRAKINGVLCPIQRIEGTETEWKIYLKGENIMDRDKLMAKIEGETITLQQEAGYKEYALQVENEERTPSIEDFWDFYQYWCRDKGLFSDR